MREIRNEDRLQIYIEEVGKRRMKGRKVVILRTAVTTIRKLTNNSCQLWLTLVGYLLYAFIYSLFSVPHKGAKKQGTNIRLFI